MAGGGSERHLRVRISEIFVRKYKFITYLYTKVNSLVQAFPSSLRDWFWYQIIDQVYVLGNKILFKPLPSSEIEVQIPQGGSDKFKNMRDLALYFYFYSPFR